MNRSQKSDRDAAEWMPARHGAWFAAQVIAVKLEYGLSVDPAERDALETLLAGDGTQLNCVDADTTSPTVAISSDANAPVTGRFSIAIIFSEPVTGFELEDLVVANGSASEPQGNDATYAATITPEASGTVTVDIPAGAAQDSAGNHSAAADQFSILANLAPVSGSFTDDPLQPRVTPVKAVHFTELRTRIDALREAAGLARVAWTDPILRAGVTRVRLRHLLELRSALAAAYSAARRSTPAWTDTAAVEGMTPIRAVHLMELRAAVVDLE